MTWVGANRSGPEGVLYDKIHQLCQAKSTSIHEGNSAVDREVHELLGRRGKAPWYTRYEKAAATTLPRGWKVYPGSLGKITDKAGYPDIHKWWCMSIGSEHVKKLLPNSERWANGPSHCSICAPTKALGLVLLGLEARSKMIEFKKRKIVRRVIYVALPPRRQTATLSTRRKPLETVRGTTYVGSTATERGSSHG